MITKRDAEILEQIVRSMSERQSWGLVGWLSNAAEGPFWDCIRPKHRGSAKERDMYDGVGGNHGAL
jgi:hypothetical protein